MQTTCFTLLLATLLLAPATEPLAEGHDRGSLTLAPGPDGVRIPIDVRGNHIYFRGRIDDSDSLWMVLDSGASANAIDAGVARTLGLAITRIDHDARGAGGRVDAGLVREATLRLPGATLTGAPTTTLPLEAFKRQTGRAMEAIIGHPLMDRCVVRIDYLGRTLELLPADGFAYTGTGIVLPLTFKNHLPYVTARLTLPGRKPFDGRFLIDLGSTQALILSPTFVKKEKVLEAIPSTIEARGRGVGGQVPSRQGRVARFEIGGIGFDRPITGLPVSEDNRISAAGTTGNIGGEFLRRFTVIFDYPRHRMILEPNASLGDPFEADMSGLGPRMGPDGSGLLEVEWILPDSPAAEAGVRPNDLIEQIDGRPAIEVGVPGLREMFRHEGATHRLQIRRGDERIEIALTTRRLI
jgi:aspartyl protease/PDZ domain-containing protein